MANLEIKHLVSLNRFPENESKILLAIVYLPIGVILFLLRCIMTLVLFILGQVLPDTRSIQSFLNNLACLCFGITVSVENIKKRENVEVYVSNSLSVLDHIAVSKAVGFVLPLNKTPLQNLSALGIVDLGSLSNPDTLKKNIDMVTKEKKTPLLICPEGSPTNGKALLKFNSKYFKLFQKVQPLCITIKRPFLDISVSTLGSTYINDILYFMFSPFTNYSVKFLPSMERKSFTEEEFADIVRENMASELNIETTSFSSADIIEWSKRQIAEERRRNQDRSNSQAGGSRFPNPELVRMATQVKEVLPHVPVSAIYNDLAVTRSVDTTITNILEGRVRFVPETTIRTSQTASTSGLSSTTYNRSTAVLGNSSDPSQLNMGASSFGKTAVERTKSFQERKEQLISAARRRYIEKHNLDIPV